MANQKIQKGNKKYYESRAEEWTNQKTNSFFHEKEFTYLASLLKKGDTVIDIACAWGIHVPLFVGIGHKLRYVGIDFSKKMIAIAKRRFPLHDFRIGDITKRETLPKEKAVVFMMSAVLMHMPLTDWADIFANIDSMTKKNAIGYITFPYEAGDALEDSRHFIYLDKAAFSKEIKKYGWKVVKTVVLKNKARHKWNGYFVKKTNV